MTTQETKRRLSDWFHQWRSPLRKFLLGRGAVAVSDLDDVAQEVFLRLLRYDRAELVEHPQAYLFKVAANVAAEWSIRARHRHPHEPKWLGDLLAQDSPDDNVAHAMVQAEIERALNTLPLRHREILKLQFAEGLGQAEIAVRLGVTPRSVKRSLAKSYSKLRMELPADLLGAVTHGRQ
jgi:RNA polymerase sigma factor (sigma-70 family)